MNDMPHFDRVLPIPEVQVPLDKSLFAKSDEFEALVHNAYESIEKTTLLELHGMASGLEKVVTESKKEANWLYFKNISDELLHPTERANPLGTYQTRVPQIQGLIDAIQTKIAQLEMPR